MSQSDCAAIDVYFFPIEAQLFFNREVLRGKSLVHFDEINVVQSQSGFLQGNLGRRNRPAAHHLGIDSGNAPAHNASHRTDAALAGFVERHDDDRSCAIHDSAGIARGDRAVFSEGGPELGQAFERGLRAPVVVFGQGFAGRLTLGIFQRHRNQFFLQTSFFIGCICELLGTQSKFILHFASDALLRSVQLGGIRHVQAAIGVEQGDHKRIFHPAAGCEVEAVASANGEWGLRHGFHAAGQNQVGLAQLDHLGGVDDGLDAASAQPVDGERRRLDGQACAQGHMPGPIDGIARGLLGVAENRVIEFPGIKAGAFDGTRARDGAQFLGGKVFQLAAVTPKRRAGPANDGDVAGFQHAGFLVLFEMRMVQCAAIKLVSLSARMRCLLQAGCRFLAYQLSLRPLRFRNFWAMVGEVKPITAKFAKEAAKNAKNRKKRVGHCSWVCGADKSLWPTATRRPRPPPTGAG